MKAKMQLPTTDLRTRIYDALVYYNVLKFEDQEEIESYSDFVEPIIDECSKCYNETDLQFRLHSGFKTATEYTNNLNVIVDGQVYHLELPPLESFELLAKDLYNIWRTKK